MSTLIRIAFAILNGLYGAWVATLLWGWHIAPFYDLPTPSVWHMYGLILTAALIFPHASMTLLHFDKKVLKSEAERTITGIIGLPILNTTVLGIGYLCHTML